MPKFDMKSLLNAQSRKAEEKTSTVAGGMAWKTERIPLEKIVPSKENHFGIRDIEQLAASIEEVGLLHNLVVRPIEDTGRYEIISGERRYSALTLLHDSGKSEWSAAPCLVVSADQNMAKFQLLIANAMTRDLTDYEQVMQAQEIKQAMMALKKSGHKFSGRLRENVAEFLGVSAAQMGVYESIATHLIPALMEEFKENRIGISAAYKLSCMTEPEQCAAFNEYGASGKEKLKVKDVKKPQPEPPAEPPTREELPGQIKIEIPEAPPAQSSPPPNVEPPAAPTIPAARPVTATPSPLSATAKPKQEARTVHELKTLPEFFAAAAAGIKPFEYRKDDRGFQVGDVLRLKEYNPQAGGFTGAALDVSITYILRGGAMGVPEGYAVLATKVL